MNSTMWDLQIGQTGDSLSNFQMEVMGDLYGGRPHVRRTSQWNDRPARRAMMTRSTPQWSGVALKSALAMLPLVVSIYVAL
jgi:hypothetical protein